MTLKLLPLEVEDLDAYSRLLYLTYRETPERALWDREPTAEEYGITATQRGKAIVEKTRNKFSYKVIDTDLPQDEEECKKVNGGIGRQLVSVGKWTAYPESRTKEEVAADNIVPTPTAANNAAAFAAFVKGILDAASVYHLDPHVRLESLVTHPLHQGRGAGKLVVAKVIETANGMKLKSLLEGSAAGAPMYRKMGFVDVGRDIVTDFTPYGSVPTTHKVMIRDVGPLPDDIVVRLPR